MPAHLKFFYGPMDCGKSTLALQIDHNHARQGRSGLVLLTTDFRSLLLPGAKRLIELADEISAIQVEVRCWCGRAGQQNARVVDGRVVREGNTVLVADTVHGSRSVRYQVLCRAHYRSGDLGPESVGDQLTLD